MKPHRIILLLALAVLATGCFKKVAYQTTYVLKPLQQIASGDTYTTLPGLKAYAFAADTAAWRVASYDDALNGILTSRSDASQQLQTPFSTAEAYETEGLENTIQLHLDRPSQLLVAVDTEHKIYAVTQQSINENSPLIVATLIFKPWKESTSYKEGNWTFYNEFYVAPTELACSLTATVESVEGGEAALLSQARVYAFAVDTTLWKIASYNDAYNRVITSKTGTQTLQNPFIATERSGTGVYDMTVSGQPLMVVVVSPTFLTYSYTQFTVDLQGQSPSFAFTLHAGQQQWKTVNDGWVTVREQYAPTTAQADKR